MKIQELRFKNLNSLYGEWHIDFNSPEYANNGIFALIGPTGAGKSSILDAICLALYGETPRLQSITKANNEIMSRQTGECHAEIIFSSQAGTFLCRWEQRRAKKKADGALQSPEHQISDMLTGKILETSRNGVLKLVEEKTGMDYDRFTRSILLAQGKFDGFLKAKVEEKSSILEQITGTKIYSEISRLVHEKQRSEKDSLQLLLAENKSIALLSDEEMAEIQKNITLQEVDEKKFTEEHSLALKNITWHKNILVIKKELQDIYKEKEEFASKIQAFIPQKEQLKEALKAYELDSTYTELKGLRDEQNKTSAFIKTKQELIPSLEESSKKSEEAQTKSTANLTAQKALLQQNSLLFQKVRLLDQSLNIQQKSLLEQVKQRDTEQERISLYQKDILKIAENEKQQQKELLSLQAWFTENQKDAWLVSGLGTVIEQLKTLLSIQQEGSKERDIETKAKELLVKQNLQFQKYSKEVKKQKADGEILHKTLEAEQKNLENLLETKLLREYQTQKENLLREKILITRIVNLESYRNALEDNAPCPLCGSHDHPYAKGNIPTISDIDKQIIELEKRIKQAEELEIKIKKLEIEEKTLQKSQNETLLLEQNARKDTDSTQITLTDLTKRVEKSIEIYREKEKEILDILSPLGISSIPSSEITSVYDSLQKRLNVWQEKEKEKTDKEKQLTSITAETEKTKALLKEHESSHKESQIKYTLIEKDFLTAQQERTALFATKNVDEEEKSLLNTLNIAEQNEIRSKEIHEKNKQNLDNIKTTLNTLKQQTESRELILQSVEVKFAKTLATAEFENEAAYHTASLTAEERKQLQGQEKALEIKEQELTTTHNEREKRLTLEQEKKLCTSTLEELELDFPNKERALKNIQESLIKERHTLERDKQDKEKFKDKETQIIKQKKEVERWEKLHTLIGSADGKKYRNFAQGLTFELMLAHANKQLYKMSDRYLLIRDKNEALILNVMDNYQGGEIRSALNLSGGESFIISLALALGLSQMASQKVRVDSLFLDEGFGTLDEDALETALETLSTIQQEGKLIGIISHVPALKERISTQIKVIPKSGGKSVLVGAGCSQVE